MKAETLSRQGIETKNGVSEFRRSTLRKLAHSGVPYETLLSPPAVVNGCRAHTPPPVQRHNLKLPTSPPPHTLPTPSLPLPNLPRRSHSVDALDSMIIIQYVENDTSINDITTNRSDSHLARLSYAKVSDVKREEEHFGHITINKNGTPPVIAPSTSLGMINVLQRIQDHTPTRHAHSDDVIDHAHSSEKLGHTYSIETEDSESRSLSPENRVLNRYSKFRRSRSSEGLSAYHSNRHWTKFETVSEDEVRDGMEWSLGESIMSTMSQHGLTLFDLENPTSASEHEVNKAWPKLKEKMKIWKSQHSLDKLDSSSEAETVFSPTHHLNNNSITITAH